MEPLIPPQASASSPAQVPVEPQPMQPVQPLPPPPANQVPIQPTATVPYIVPGMPMATPVAQVTFPIQVQAAPQQFSPVPPATPPKSRLKKILFILVLLSLTSGAAYGMYVYQDTIKAMLPSFGDGVILTEDNFTSSLMNSFKSINAAEYTFSANIFIIDREKGTISMDSKLGPTPEQLASYKNDYKKSEIIHLLLSSLQYPTSSHSSSWTVVTYPKDLTELKKIYNEKYNKYSSEEDKKNNNQIIDSSITYRVINGGSDFELIATFETDEAVSALKENNSLLYSYKATSSSDIVTTRFEGKKIVYTKGSNPYLIISSEMKRPLLSQLGYYLKDLPQEFFIAGTSTILSKLVDGQLPEVKAGVTAEGNFSDLSYKFSLDTILKDKMFYYHINNFPALGLLGGLSTLKGKWVKVDLATLTSSSSRYNPDMVGQLSVGVQEGLEKNKETAKKMMEALAKSADSSKLISFVNQPSHEKLGKENVTKYQFFIKRESLPVFLTALEQETSTDTELKKAFIDYKKEMDAMLTSPDFAEIYDYSKANIFMTVWTRKDGIPVQTQVRFRIIPSIESKNLKEKQIELIITMMLSKINDTITIEAPEGAKTYEEIVGTSTSRGFFE